MTSDERGDGRWSMGSPRLARCADWQSGTSGGGLRGSLPNLAPNAVDPLAKARLFEASGTEKTRRSGEVQVSLLLSTQEARASPLPLTSVST